MNGEIYLLKNFKTGLFKLEFNQPDNDIQKQFYSSGDMKLILTINRTEKEYKQLLNDWECYKTLCGWYNDTEGEIFDIFFEENYPFTL